MTAMGMAIDALAAYRLTKLVVDDQLTTEARDAVIRGAYEAAGKREWAEANLLGGPNPAPGEWADVVVVNDDDPPKLAFLVTCPWCAGMWVSLGIVVVRRVAPRLWRPLAEALALSAAAGLIAENLQQ